MKAIEDIVSLLTRLPGIGRKSALRITYYLLKSDIALSDGLIASIQQLRTIHFAPNVGPMRKQIDAKSVRILCAIGASSVWWNNRKMSSP